MTAGTYGSALAICVLAVVLGRGAWALCGGREWTWLCPAFGLAVLLVVCEVAIRAPGHGWTAIAVVLVLVVASLVVARRAEWPPLEGALVALVAFLITAIPFLANGRVGLLGVSFNNDPSAHLMLAAGLRDPAVRSFTGFGPGYPVGPHAIVAMLSVGLGTSLAAAFNGLLVATPVLVALTVLAGVRDLTAPRRLLVCVLAAFFYLPASWYAQAAYKEPVMGVLLLALVLLALKGRREGFARPWSIAVPAGLLVAAMVYDYSYSGLLWPGAFLAVWGAAELLLAAAGPARRTLLRGARRCLPALAAGAALFVAAFAIDWSRIHLFLTKSGSIGGGTIAIPKANIGNLAGPLSFRESFGLWFSQDFRFWPRDVSQTKLLAYFAIAVVLFGVVRELLRRDLALPASLFACGAAYLYSKHTQSPYVAAKALVIPGPLIALTAGRGLLQGFAPGRWRLALGCAAGAVAVVFAFCALRSSYQTLKGAQVGPGEHASELSHLRPMLHGRRTLMLVDDEYYQSELLPDPANSPSRTSSVGTAPFSPQKPWVYGTAIDFDSVSAATLDGFDYAITVRGAYQSQAPSNFRLVAQTRSYDLWHRTGPTQPRRVLEASGAPGAVLKCRTAAGRRIVAQGGVARILRAPVAVALPGQLAPGGGPGTAQITLPRGTWDLSLAYTSPFALHVRVGSLGQKLPPNLDRPGTPWPVGRLRAPGGALAVSVAESDPALISAGTHGAYLGALVAVEEGTGRTVPVRAACGRYVDWYRPG